MSNIIVQVKKFRYLEYIILSLILLLAFIVRLYKINNPIADWHSWRQADTASVSRTFFRDGINLLYPRYHDISSIQTGTYNPNGYRFVEFPVYNAIHVLLASGFPRISLEVWGRLVSIFSAVSSSFLLFLIGRRFMGTWGGVLASFFYAFLPFNIYFTRVILPDPLAISFALFATWLFVKFLDSKENNLLLFSAAISFAVGMLIKPFVFFYSIPIAYLAVKKYGFKGILNNISFLLAIVIALVPFFLWRVWMNQFPQGIPLFKWAFNGDGIRFKPSFWRWIFGERLGRLILGGWGLIPFAFGLLRKTKEFIFNHFFLLGMFLYVVVFATASVRHDYYQTMVIPAVSLTLAAGSLYMWEAKGYNKFSMRGLLVFSILIMFLTGAEQIKEFYKINHPEIIAAGKAVDKIVSKEALVIAPYNGDTAFLYQTNRWGWPFMSRSLNELINKGASVFVSVNLNDSETINIMQEYEVIERTETYVIIDLESPQK